MATKPKAPRSVQIQNKRATFDYELLDLYTAGIVLVGTEIKSLRLGKASLVDSFCHFHGGELWLHNANISEYFYGSYNNHAARRDRKLLLNKKELRKLADYAQTPGVKVVIAPARGKKLYDKRASLREKDDRREMDRAMKR